MKNYEYFKVIIYCVIPPRHIVCLALVGEGEQGRTTWLGEGEGDWEGEKTWLRCGEGAREGNLA